jgi:CIC family chloride channel protein
VQGISARNESQLFLVLTLLIGATVGVMVVGFIAITEHLASALRAAGTPAWQRFATPVLASLLVGYLLHRFFPDARGSGVPQTKAALYARQGFIPLRTVAGKFLCSSVTLASGIPLGREGPSVQIGSGIASVLGRALGLSPERVRSLVPVGAAAALAAAFNTPIAAVLFSLEELLGNLHAPILGSVVIAAATSWMVLRLLLGNEPLFHVPQYELVHPSELIVYVVLGVVGGLVSVAFVKGILWLRERFLRLPLSSRWLQPAAGGLVVGLFAFALPEFFRFGYPTVGQALNGELDLVHMAVLVGLTLTATSLCYASGNSGGIFGPSLFLGAMVGGVVGSVAHGLFPQSTATPGAYALVGMGASFAGILRVPMVSVIMIFEITHDYAIIVPLMISNLISFLVSYRLQKQPIYEALALQEGIHLPTSERAKRRLEVRLAMRPARETFDSEMTVSRCLERARESGGRAWPVVDRRGVHGVVSLAQLERAVDAGRGETRLAALLDGRTFPHLHADHSLERALQRMGDTGYDLLPVVSRADITEMEGVCTLLDVLRAFGVQRAEGPAEPEAS